MPFNSIALMPSMITVFHMVLSGSAYLLILQIQWLRIGSIFLRQFTRLCEWMHKHFVFRGNFAHELCFRFCSCCNYRFVNGHHWSSRGYLQYNRRRAYDNFYDFAKIVTCRFFFTHSISRRFQNCDLFFYFSGRPTHSFTLICEMLRKRETPKRFCYLLFIYLEFSTQTRIPHSSGDSRSLRSR